MPEPIAPVGTTAGKRQDQARRTDLSRDLVVKTALQVLDAEGIDALSMRHLADVLGVGTMSLYHYVTDKDDLSEAVVELVLRDVHDPKQGEPWTEMARAVATSFRASALSHPAAIRLLLVRSERSGSSVRWVQVWRLLLAAGMDEVQARRVFRGVSRFVVGWCLAEIVDLGDGGERARRADGDGDFAFALDALLEALDGRVSNR